MKASLRHQIRFAFFFASLLVFGLLGKASAQEQTFTIEPSATLTWAQLVGRSQGRPPGFMPPEVEAPPSLEIDINSLQGLIEVQTVGELGKTVPEGAQEVTTIAPFTLSFQALDNNTATRPPDTNGAVGKSHVMTMLNTDVRIQTKDGHEVDRMSLEDFWGVNTPFDPRIVYDQAANRWIATCDSDPRTGASSVLFAISSTSDPQGTWTFYQFDIDPGNDSWADFPDIGVNNTWIAVSNNMFTVSDDDFEHVNVLVITKATALAGGALTVKKFELHNNEFSVRVCHTYGNVAALYLIENHSRSQVGPVYRMFAVTGNATNPSLNQVNYSIPATSNPNFDFNPNLISASQLGTTRKIDTGDFRLQNAVYRNGYIYTVHAGGYPTTGTADRTEIRWFAFSPITGQGFGDYMGGGSAGTHWFYPSISTNAAGDGIIGFSRSDASRYVQACYMVRDGSQLTNDFGPVHTFKVGEGIYDPIGETRWGDYSASMVDPSDDTSFWTIQEYAAGGNQWATWWTGNRDLDQDDDGILDDGDFSDIAGDNPCTGGATVDCDDNCPTMANSLQADCNSNGVGDVCDASYLVVGSTVPGPNRVGASDPLVTVQFCEAMNELTVNTTSVVVRGNTQGVIPGTLYLNGGTVLYFIPTNPFPKNELITVTLTSSIATQDGTPDFLGYTWSFTTAGCSQPAFKPESNFASGPQPIRVVVADFNGDHHPDVVACSVSNLNTVSLMLNNGSGGFPNQTTLNLSGNLGASDLTTGDYDGDGDTDLGIVCTGSNTFILMANNGAGGFTLAHTHNVTDVKAVGAMADMDNDGDLDFVLSASGSTDDVVLISNSGNGSSAGIVSLPALNNPERLMTVDVNNDGALDIVVGHPNDGMLSTFIKQINGSFTRFDVASVNPRSMTAADFNGDGFVDMATYSSVVEELNIFYNNGNGAFALSKVMTPIPGWAVTAADLDNDGDSDLATGTHSATQLAWIKNQGNNSYALQAANNGSRSGADLAVADLDGEGSPDVVVVNQDASENSISVILNSGPPAAPTLTSPANGAGMPAPATPLLNCADVTAALYYHFVIDDDPNFGSSISSPMFLPNSEWTVSPQLSAGTYYWRAQAINACGAGPWSAPRSLTVNSGGGAGCGKICYTESDLWEVAPKETRILLARPNPFHGSAEIHWAMKEQGEVRLQVFDIQGRQIMKEDFGVVEAGVWKWIWNGNDGSGASVSKGVYFVKLVTNDAMDTVQIVRLN